MSRLSTTYLLPAIILNPAFILHLINTFVSHLVPPPSPPVISHSPHPFMESIGPVPGSTPYLDMHADDALCWRYTAVMVVVQVLAFGRVQDNRVARRERKSALKAEREKRREVLEAASEQRKLVKAVGGLDGAASTDDYTGLTFMNGNGSMNGGVNRAAKIPEKTMQTEGMDATESEASLTETSEEEMLI